MAEAEDVLLEAAERATAAVRALWARRAGGAEAAEAAGRRRLAAWLAAWSGRSLALFEEDPPAAPGWLARAWGRPPPWALRPRAVASIAEEALFLPRSTLLRLGSAPDPAPLLPALALARRAAQPLARRTARRAEAADAEAPVARDVAWALEAARLDAELARALPGLARALRAARREALGARPPLAQLSSAERAVETLYRALLETPLDETEGRLASLLGAESPRDFARRLAASLGPAAERAYRGVAPVAHWGVPAARAGRPRALALSAARERERVPGRSRDLPRRLARRAPEPGDAERGPFLLPTSDPHISVQDARGHARPPDGGDEDPDALAEELSRLRELPTVATAGAVRESLVVPGARASVRAEAPAERDVARGWVYPEWDHAQGRYRRRGCIVRERVLAGSGAAWAERVRREHAALLRQLQRQFEALRPRRVRVPRRLDGDGVDLDGWVEEFASRRAGLAGGGRVYTEERPNRREIAVALLVDASGSTDAWVSGRERVIDVAKQAAFCFGEALAALGDRFALYAFSGCGAADVRIRVAKRFEEPWGAAVRSRLGALEPDRFTRLGGALRHVTAALARSGARVRVLLLLSDGKPNDEDAYEGAYGVEDARQAVAEARACDVRTFCITIDREGPAYLPRLFGPHGYTVLWDVAQLPARLPRIYRRLTAGASAAR